MTDLGRLGSEEPTSRGAENVVPRYGKGFPNLPYYNHKPICPGYKGGGPRGDSGASLFIDLTGLIVCAPISVANPAIGGACGAGTIA